MDEKSPKRNIKNAELKERSFQLFCRIDNLAEVSRQLSISRNLVYAWSRQDNWKDRRLQIKNRLKVHTEQLQRTGDNKVLRAFLVELQFLDHLQGIVSDELVSGRIRPKSWRDLLMTQKFINDRKEKILDGGNGRLIPPCPEAEGEVREISPPEDMTPTFDEEEILSARVDE